jgi:hypothetical protein
MLTHGYVRNIKAEPGLCPGSAISYLNTALRID